MARLKGRSGEVLVLHVTRDAQTTNPIVAEREAVDAAKKISREPRVVSVWFAGVNQKEEADPKFWVVTFRIVTDFTRLEFNLMRKSLGEFLENEGYIVAYSNFEIYRRGKRNERGQK